MSIQLIQQAIFYMEKHILEDITYTEVAKSVYMSSYNFHRIFSFITGMTAGEYLRKRRLTLAAQELQKTDISIIEAAYKYGYETPESFSKAFARFHGSTPKQARQKGAKLHLFSPLVIKIIMEGGRIMDYRMERRESQRFLTLVRAFPNEIINDDADHSISDFWEECFGPDCRQLHAEHGNGLLLFVADIILKPFQQHVLHHIRVAFLNKISEVLYCFRRKNTFYTMQKCPFNP